MTQEKKPNKILGDELLRLNPKLQKVYCIHRDHSSYDLQTDLEEHFSYIHCYDRQLIERSDKKLIVKYSKQESDSPLKYRRCDDGEFEVYDTPSAVWLVYNASDVLLFKIVAYFDDFSSKFYNILEDYLDYNDPSEDEIFIDCDFEIYTKEIQSIIDRISDLSVSSVKKTLCRQITNLFNDNTDLDSVYDICFLGPEDEFGLDMQQIFEKEGIVR